MPVRMGKRRPGGWPDVVAWRILTWSFIKETIKNQRIKIINKNDNPEVITVFK